MGHPKFPEFLLEEFTFVLSFLLSRQEDKTYRDQLFKPLALTFAVSNVWSIHSNNLEGFVGRTPA